MISFWSIQEYSMLIHIILILTEKKCVRPLNKECVIKHLFSYFSSKTYVVGTQKNCLNVTFF